MAQLLDVRIRKTTEAPRLTTPAPLGLDLSTKDKRRREIRYREAWAFKGQTEELIAAQVASMPRPVVHLCAGGSPLGDIKVDIAPPLRPTIAADARHLPFRSGSVPSLVMDPPWSTKGWTFADRMNVVAEVGRVLQLGGQFMLYAPWWPTLLWARLDTAWVRENGAHALPFAPVVLSRWTKTRADDHERAAELARRAPSRERRKRRD